jgi:hypothetical protein
MKFCSRCGFAVKPVSEISARCEFPLVPLADRVNLRKGLAGKIRQTIMLKRIIFFFDNSKFPFSQDKASQIYNPPMGTWRDTDPNQQYIAD